ncbi:MAG: DUF5678 domain-containing protein [Caldilineaceae bacterium]
MVQVLLPDQTAEKLQRSAAKQGLDTNQLLVQLVEQYVANEPMPTEVADKAADEEGQKIEQEQKFYEMQHPILLKTYKGQYIAMHEGKVIDHDADRIALRRRIRSAFGRTAILITPVLEESIQTIWVLSPRLLETHQ